MKCQRQPAFLRNKPTPITDVWEIHLSPTLWLRVTELARHRGCTYSTITRFCVFRLAEPERLRDVPLFARLKGQISRDAKHAPVRHRHMLCLYGEDVKLIRLAALELNLTVSAFIRLALWLFLPRLDLHTPDRRFISRIQLFHLGTKRWLSIACAGLNHERNPAIRRFAFSSFPPWLWW